LAVLVLGLVALGSFTLGFGRQVAPPGPSPFPRTSLTSFQRPTQIPEAAPAPTLQVAEAEPRPVRRAPLPEPRDAPPDVDLSLFGPRSRRG